MSCAGLSHRGSPVGLFGRRSGVSRTSLLGHLTYMACHGVLSDGLYSLGSWDSLVSHWSTGCACLLIAVWLCAVCAVCYYIIVIYYQSQISIYTSTCTCTFTFLFLFLIVLRTQPDTLGRDAPARRSGRRGTPLSWSCESPNRRYF